MGDAGILQQPVAHLLGDAAQHPLAGIAVNLQIQHFTTPDLQHHLRLLGVQRQRVDPVHFLPDILIGFLLIGIRKQFHGDHAASLARGGSDLFHTLDAAHRLLNGQHNAGLHLFRTRAGIRHGDGDGVEGKFGKHLLFDAKQHQRAADEQKQHDQIWRHTVADHPGDGPAMRHGFPERSDFAHGALPASRRPVVSFMPSTGDARSVVTTRSPAANPPRTNTSRSPRKITSSVRISNSSAAFMTQVWS